VIIITDYYDTWDPESFGNDAGYQQAIREFTRGLIKGHVLDTGCGSRVVYSLSQADSWTGVDISRKMSEHIIFFEKPNNLTCKFHLADIRNLPFKDNVFDTVVVQFILHHLGEKNRKNTYIQVEKAFKQLKRVIRPGGKIIIIENTPGFLERPYHVFYPILWKIGLSFGVRLPYFLKPCQLKFFAAKEKCNYISAVQIPINEKIYNPVLKMRVPAFFSSDLFQKMMLFLFEVGDE
jgi:ubiquinone/menaquinone biosynthesis C-methylase UbiE